MVEGQFVRSTTILPVADIDETLDWYDRVLGFKQTYVHGNGRRGEEQNFANYAIMKRDAVELHFILDEGGAVWTRAGTGHLSLTVHDVDSLFAEVKKTTATIARDLQKENWPARGFNLTDPSGNDVHLEQPI
jgi:uncharacterized glyoxalase superfamily protein PhnB